MSKAVLRSPVRLGAVLAALLGLVAVTDLFALGAGLLVRHESAELGARGPGVRLSSQADRADTLHSLAGGAQALAFVLCGVVFLVWFHRVRVNAEVFRPDGHSKARAWAIAGWVVPIANVYYPRRIALDVWDASGPWSAPRPHTLINAWWTLWLVSSNLGFLMRDVYDSAHSGAAVREAALEGMAVDALDIAAAALALLLVLRLTRMQRERALAGPVPVTV